MNFGLDVILRGNNLEREDLNFCIVCLDYYRLMLCWILLDKIWLVCIFVIIKIIVKKKKYSL